jgi:hypothetical protein
MRYELTLLIAKLWLAGKVGGAGGTNFPSTVFNCVIPSVTVVDVVKVTALLTRFPSVLVPMAIALPITPIEDADDHDKFPAPSVDKI